MILLDTNAVIWVLQNHRRVRPLAHLPRLYISPASVLELQLLMEAGRLRPLGGKAVGDVAHDPRWLQDEPASGDWFHTALDVGWTHDPFDRLIVAHARLRGWKLATGDATIAGHLSPRELITL